MSFHSEGDGGKTLPYAAVALVLAVAVTLLIGSNAVGLAAMVPVLAFALATALLAALLARSPRELTFYLVATTVLLSTFLFLPAIFAQIHPVSFLSPVTVVIATLRGDPVTLLSFLYATLPLATATLVLALVAVGLYREETLFAPGPPTAKLVAALDLLTRRRTTTLAAGALAVPFAIGLELFLLIFAVTLEVRTAFLVFLFGSALVEEALKGLVAYARARPHGPTPRSPWTTGLLVGGGFFVGEKAALIFSLVGFGLLPLGDDALATFGVARTLPLILGPLLLHVATATLTALGARRGLAPALLGFAAATLTHAAYNTALLALALEGVRP